MVGERQEQKSPLRRSKFLPFLSSFSGSDMPCADKSSGGTAGRQPLHLTPGPPTVLPSLLLIAFRWEEVRWAQPTLTWKNRHGFTLGGFCMAFIHLQDHTRCHHSNLCSWGSVTGGCWCWPGKQLCAGPVARLASCSFRSPCLAMLSTPLTHPHPWAPAVTATSPPCAPRAKSPTCLTFPSQPGQSCREAPREHPHGTLRLSGAPSCSL